MPFTISKGYTFGTTELVTNVKLHTLVDSAVITETIEEGFSDNFATTGWVDTPSKSMYYRKQGNLVLVSFGIVGTSNATSSTFEVPYASYAFNSVTWGGVLRYVYDNNSAVTAAARFVLENNGATVTCYKDMSTGTWTNSGTKSVYGQFSYVSAS